MFFRRRHQAKVSPEANAIPVSLGLHTLYCDAQPAVDIIAVHGLMGHAFKTWTCQTTDKCWLKDPEFLPTAILRCRVLSYGYDARVVSVFQSTCSDRVHLHAHTFISALAADREVNDAMERPIIFVCHSLGGIIVKRALIYAESRTSMKMLNVHLISAATYGVIFMGTPHNGSNKAQLASYVQKAVKLVVPSKLVDSDGQLLKTLEENSETLQNITDQFIPLMRQFALFFFWEQNKTDFKYGYDYVVTQGSAVPPGDFEASGLPADHSSMCKFASASLPEYKLVAAILKRFTSAAPEAIHHKIAHYRQKSQLDRHNEAAELLRSS